MVASCCFRSSSYFQMSNQYLNNFMISSSSLNFREDAFIAAFAAWFFRASSSFCFIKSSRVYNSVLLFSSFISSSGSWFSIFYFYCLSVRQKNKSLRILNRSPCDTWKWSKGTHKGTRVVSEFLDYVGLVSFLSLPFEDIITRETRRSLHNAPD